MSATLLAADAARGQEVFRRGDVDTSGTVDVSDPLNSLSFQFLGTFEPPCLDAADSDDSGVIDVSDPAKPELLHAFEAKGDGYLREITDGYVFLGMNWESVLIYDFESVEKPELVGLYLMNTLPSQIRVHDETAYMVNGLYGVEIIDLASGNILLTGP